MSSQVAETLMKLNFQETLYNLTFRTTSRCRSCARNNSWRYCKLYRRILKSDGEKIELNAGAIQCFREIVKPNGEYKIWKKLRGSLLRISALTIPWLSPFSGPCNENCWISRRGIPAPSWLPRSSNGSRGGTIRIVVIPASGCSAP